MSEERCHACKRSGVRLRGSHWHGERRICLDCFFQWYDPDNSSFDNCNPLQLGNYVRSKHGLEPLTEEQWRAFDEEQHLWTIPREDAEGRAFDPPIDVTDKLRSG